MKYSEVNIMELLDALIDYRGKTPKKSEKGIPALSAKSVRMGQIDYSQCYYISEDEYKKFMVRGFPKKGDILITTEAPLGNVAKLDKDDVVVAQRLLTVRGKKGLLDNDYLLYYLQTKEGQQRLTAHQSGTTVVGIRQDEFRKINIRIPSYIEQQKIGKILSVIDEKIYINNKIDFELGLIEKELYEYWFVQFDFPDENGKPYRLNGGKMVWNDELKRNIPNGWAVSTLKGLYEIERGLSYSSKDIESGKGVPMINLACIDRSRNYRDGELKYYNGKISEKSILKPFDLLIACTDLTREREIIGCPILTPDDGQDYTYSMDIAKIHFTNKNLVDLYMYMALRTDFYHNYIKRWASGTNVLHLNLDGLDWYPMCIPNIELQNKYAEIVKNIHSKRSKIILENNQLKKLRDFILPMLMNGQVIVK